MPGELTSGLSLDMVVWLQNNGNDFFDALAKILHFMGRNTFYLLALSSVYWSLDKRLGRRLLFALLIGSLLNTFIKEVVRAPRPFQVYPDQVHALVEQAGYSFPSGHVMQVIVVWGTAAVYTGRRRFYVLVGGFALLMAWARLYAGVHYPQDVIGSVVFGLLTWRLLPPLFRFAALYAERAPLHSQIAAVFLIGFIALTIGFTDPDGVAVAGILWGAGFGVIVERRRIRFTVTGAPSQRLLRYLLGIALVGGLYSGLGALAGDTQPIRLLPVLTLVGFMALAGWPYLAQKIGLLSQSED